MFCDGYRLLNGKLYCVVSLCVFDVYDYSILSLCKQLAACSFLAEVLTIKRFISYIYNLWYWFWISALTRTDSKLVRSYAKTTSELRDDRLVQEQNGLQKTCSNLKTKSLWIKAKVFTLAKKNELKIIIIEKDSKRRKANYSQTNKGNIFCVIISYAKTKLHTFPSLPPIQRFYISFS